MLLQLTYWILFRLLNCAYSIHVNTISSLSILKRVLRPLQTSLLDWNSLCCYKIQLDFLFLNPMLFINSVILHLKILQQQKSV